MNRHIYIERKEPLEYPRFCAECERHSDSVAKNGLCIRHILEHRLEKEEDPPRKTTMASLIKWFGLHE